MSKLQQRLRELIDGSEWKELEDLLLNTEDEWILEILERKMAGSDGPKWIGGMLTSLKCGTRESTALRIKIYENALKHTRNEVGGDRGTGEIVGVLMLHIDAFPPDAVLTLTDQFVEYIEKGECLQGRWVSVLPKLIMNLSQKEKLTIDGKEMSGEDYRYQVVKTLCDMNWSVETATSLLPVFRDLDLPKEELQDVIHKVERVLKKTDYQSVPPILYHLILLGKNKLPGRILQIIIAYFNKQEKKLMKEKATRDDVNSMELDTETIEESKHSDLTEAQGTVILHVTHQAQDYPALVRDFLKFIKSSVCLTERVITPFNLALSLSLSSIEKYEDQILESLKSCILRYYRQEERSKQSQWLREAWGESCHVTTAFKSTIENCIMGWDQVSQGIVHLGFKLLESGSGPKGESYSSQKAVALASVILPLILKKQPHLAGAILSKISNFIVSASSPLQYIEILGKLVKLSPLVLLDHSSLIQEQLECLVFLPLSAASHLLQALLPLFKMSMALKDSLMIILRKMLFSKKVESRQAAVKGFMQFLRHFRVMGTLPSSQASMSFSSSLSAISINADVHSVFNNSTNEALCLELLGVLRRCFSQQYEVKSVFYCGMYDVCRSNPKLIVSILELLHHQCKQYLDTRPVVFNPIDLRKIVVVQGDTVQLMEPMGDLLSSVGACKLYLEKHRAEGNVDEDDEDEECAISVLNDICSLFDHVTEKLAGCGLEDMGFDTNGEYVLSTTPGEKNVACAKVMVSVFDSLIEYSFSQGASTSQEKMQSVISLFKSQKKIVDLVKEKTVKIAKKDGKKGKGRTGNKALVNFTGNIRLPVVADMLRVSLGNDEESDLACVEMLSGCHDLQMYLLNVLEHTLSSVKVMTSTEREKVLPHLRTVARVLLHDCVANIAPEDTSDERHVQRIRQCLLILSSLLSIFCKYYDTKLEAILKEVNGRTDNVSLNGLLYKIYKKCQKMLLKILHHEDNGPLLKDTGTVLQIMLTISHAMEPESDEITEAQSWILQLCKDQEMEHGSVAESMVTLLLFLSDQLKANHTLARGISRELHYKFGHLEEGVSVEEIGKYKLVTEGSSTSILTVLLNYVDDSLGLVELLISKVKACITTDEEYNADDVEKSICSKFTVSIHAVHEVIQSALPLGTSTDHTLKVVTKLFNGMSLYVKYYLELYKSKSYPQISDKFERLVHVCGEMLSSPIYSTITYIEGAQKQAGNKKNEGALIARTLKESKLIPCLIYAIEQYEQQLINLSKRSKVNLMEGMKLSTSRDFRIMAGAMAEALQNTNRNGDDDDDNEEEEPEENGDAEEENIKEDDDQEADNKGSGSSSGSKRKGKSLKAKGNGPSQLKGVSKRKAVGDENDGNSQNRLSQPSKKSKLGMKR